MQVGKDNRDEEMKLWLCSANGIDYEPFGLVAEVTEEKAIKKFSNILDEDGTWYASVSAEEVNQVDGYDIKLINKKSS
jgi:hypothetical protein